MCCPDNTFLEQSVLIFCCQIKWQDTDLQQNYTFQTFVLLIVDVGLKEDTGRFNNITRYWSPQEESNVFYYRPVQSLNPLVLTLSLSIIFSFIRRRSRYCISRIILKRLCPQTNLPLIEGLSFIITKSCSSPHETRWLQLHVMGQQGEERAVRINKVIQIPRSAWRKPAAWNLRLRHWFTFQPDGPDQRPKITLGQVCYRPWVAQSNTRLKPTWTSVERPECQFTNTLSGSQFFFKLV